jgi:tetratricopeptide (TPR) repeat protein
LSGIAILLGAAILVLIFVPAIRKKWMLGTLVATVVIALIAAILILPNKESELARSVKERAASLATNTSTTSIAGANIAERLKIWKKTAKMISDHPLLGVGPGNWKVVIPSYGLDSTVFAKGYYAPDRVHNVYLQIASESGIAGAIFYFGFWFIIVSTGFAFLRKTNNEKRKVIVILMLAGLSGVAVDFMFSFANERVEHSIYTILMGAILVGMYAQEAMDASHKIIAPKRILVILLAAVATFNLFLAKKRLDFESHLMRAVSYNDQKQFSQTLEEVKQGTNEFFTIDITGNPLEMYSGIAYKELKNFDAATRDFKKAFSYSPYNCRIYNNRAILYWELKQLQNSINDYNIALRYAPEFETVLKNLAFTYYQAERYKECIETINRMKEKDEMTINVLNDAKKKSGLQ